MTTSTIGGITTAATVVNAADLFEIEQGGTSKKAAASLFSRTRLAANTTYYVRTDGDDANTGLANTSGGAWLTVQHAIDFICGSLDLNGYTVVIQCADGIYSEALNLYPLTGAANIQYTDELTPSAVFQGNAGDNTAVSIANSSTGPVSAQGVPYGWGFKKLRLDASGGGYVAVNLFQSGVDIDSVNFKVDSGVECYILDERSYATEHGSVTVTGTALSAYAEVDHGSRFLNNGGSVTLASVVAIGNAFMLVNTQSEAKCATLFTGTATGKRYTATADSSILTDNTFPGNTAGTAGPSCFYNTIQGESAFLSQYKAVGAPVALTNNTAADILSLSLTVGVWDVEGNVNFTGTTATVTGGSIGISTTSATLPTDGSEVYDGTVTTVLSDTSSVTAPRKRIAVTAPTTVYMVAKKLFSAGTVSAFGGITARQVG